MIEREPMTVGTRGRLYTTSEQRDDLGIDGYGHGEDVFVEVMAVDRGASWGVYAQTAAFQDSLGTYGEIRVPSEARAELGLADGDAVRVSVDAV